MPPLQPTQPASEIGTEFVLTKETEGTAAAPKRSVPDATVPYDILQYIPEESVAHYQLAPLGLQDGVLEVGMVDPDNINGVDALNFITRKTGVPFKVFQISTEDFKRVLGMYRGLKGDVGQAVVDLATERRSEKRPIESDERALRLDDVSIGENTNSDISRVMQEDAPTIKIVSTILRYAIDGGASDIHVEPMSDGVRVRYRVDGVLHTSVVLPINTHRGLVARIKVLASVRLDEL